MRTFIAITLVTLAFFGSDGEEIDSQKTLKWVFEGYGVHFEMYQDNILKAMNTRGEGVQISIYLIKEENRTKLAHFGLGSAGSQIKLGSMGGPKQVLFLGEGERVKGEIFEVEIIATRDLVAQKTKDAGRFLRNAFSNEKKKQEPEPEKKFIKKITLD